MERRRKAMWLYPKVVGFNPPERWGHSACFFEGVVYVFGGCCGGLHFSDVLTLNVETMAWSSLATTGQRPGTRDSHGAALVGHRMLVFGGTNGGKKVNDLHVLDLRTGEWSRPQCKGAPPSPRESHTVTVVGGDRLVVFGGSGEGEGNYLSDVHVLDVPTMTWSTPEVKAAGAPPAPRDSHSAVAVGNRLFVFGGDCGDRYHGEVDVLDVDAMAWSRFPVKGASPGVRAGHAALSVGSKVYIIGGVGDKQYYSDVWVLDVTNRSWSQLEVCGQQPQGRFSHTAVVMNTDIAIYGGCGEDERPLNELLILQLGSEHPNGRYNISMCKVLSNHWSQEKRKFLRSETKEASVSNGEMVQKPREAEIEQRNPFLRGLENGRAKRRKTDEVRPNEPESEQEEHSLSLSQHSSPSQSDQEQNGAHKLSASPNTSISGLQPFVRLKANGVLRAPGPGAISSRPLKTDQFLRTIAPQHRQEVQFLSSDHKPQPQPRPPGPPLIGAEVHGTIDGAFDSGYLMTAVVNGQLFRGVLFAPGPGVTAPRPTVHHQILTSSAVPPQQQRPLLAHAIPVHARPVPQATGFVLPDCAHNARQGFPAKAVKSEQERGSSDLHDVVLTLGGPGGGK